MDFTDAYLVEPFCFLAPRERPYQVIKQRLTVIPHMGNFFLIPFLS